MLQHETGFLPFPPFFKAAQYSNFVEMPHFLYFHLLMGTGLLPAPGCWEWSCGGQECANLFEIPCWDLWMDTQRWDGRDATLLFTACEGLVLLLWAEGTGPVIRTEESLSGPEALLSRGSQTCTSVCVCWAPCFRQYPVNKNMAAGPREVTYLLRRGKSRVKNTPQRGHQEKQK